MVAIKAFVEAAELQGGHRRLRRAQLGVVSSTLGASMDMPEHLRNVVVGIAKEIDDRCFRPVLEEADLDRALEHARASFQTFAELWPALLAAIAPWLLEDQGRLVAMTRVLTDTWTSEDTLEALGTEAAGWFAAAQDARAAIALGLVKNGMPVPPSHEATIVHLCLVADFAILLGLFLAQHSHPKLIDGLAVAIGKLAHESAKNAYVLMATHRFADPEPATVSE